MSHHQRSTRSSSSNEVRSAELRGKLSSEHKLLLDAIEATLLDPLKSEIQGLKQQFGKFAEEQAVIKSTVAHLENKVEEAAVSIHQHSRRLNELEQYSRRNCLLLHGATTSDSDSVSVVLDLAKNKLGVTLSESEIDRAHPLPGRKESNSGRKPPIVIKFVSYNTRNKIFTAKSKLKGSGMYITEHLTRENAQLLRETRAKLGTAWSFDGRIFCLVDGVKKKISCLEDLDSITSTSSAGET
ncbi:uncharacterized protein LOC118431946 [Branchiostoma floridae]|uniref:Uncharacterized protein LOC118431946 n=1 Tax=Branchiostoma floridae TaxID=7739 RepID=A0A9J7NDI1_BRAFL|nr:uncharacterized protein LOC118431946 [Branchiostoma floridae]